MRRFLLCVLDWCSTIIDHYLNGPYIEPPRGISPTDYEKLRKKKKREDRKLRLFR